MNVEGPSPNSLKMLLALNRLRRHVYDGSVPPETVARNRARNKRARIARRINRRK